MNPTNTLRFHGPRLTDIREETGLSVKDLASRLFLDWRLVSLWEATSALDSPRVYSSFEPSASQLMDLARVLDAHPSDFFSSYEDALAGEEDDLHGSFTGFGLTLDGDRLVLMRKLKGLSYPQAAARARVTERSIRQAEEGRTIGTGALLRLLQVYEPRKDPVSLLPTVLVRDRGPRLTRSRPG